MHDVAGGSNIAGNMVEKSNFCRLIGMGFHTFKLIDDDDMLIPDRVLSTHGTRVFRLGGPFGLSTSASND